MTSDELKALAEKAKAFDPNAPFLCTSSPCSSSVMLVLKSDSLCNKCLGAQRAVEDIARRVEWSMMCVGELDNEDRATARPANLRGAVEYAKSAASIESYFGPPGPVAAFAKAVEEFCK